MPNAFVIHLHTGHARPHYDLMLECGQALATWQFADLLAAIDQDAKKTEIHLTPIPCRKLSDHRLAYLTYEGPVSGGRGEVRRVDNGTYAILAQDDQRWEVRFEGNLLTGQYELVRQAGDDWVLRRLA